MFNTQKEIMGRVGFTDNVNINFLLIVGKNVLNNLGYKYGIYYPFGYSSFNQYTIFA